VRIYWWNAGANKAEYVDMFENGVKISVDCEKYVVYHWNK
jgi:hypothetical protein